MSPLSMEQYRKAAEVLREAIQGRKPEILLILGSGLGGLAEQIENAVAVPYAQVPGLMHSTAPGHKGQFLCGMLAGKEVLVMQGRLHTYEGWTYSQTGDPVRIARLLGVKTLVVTNAAGAVNKSFSAGDIMLITDHIKLFGESPLRGENLEELGPRFPDMSHVYTPELQKIARAAAAAQGLQLREGVYMFFPGPQFETPAEVRAARLLGADAVGMSTVPEAITAAHCGMQVLGFTVCTNMAAGVLDQPLDADEVIEAGNAVGPRFMELVKSCVASMK